MNLNDKNKRHFSTFEIEKILNIKRELLAQWLMRGFIEPSVQKAGGRGSKHLFSMNDLYNIVLFRRLINTGIPRHDAEMLININFDSVGPEKKDKKFLFIYREDKKTGYDLGVIASTALAEEWPDKSPHKDGLAWFMSIDLLGIKTLVNKKIEEM